MCTVSILRSNEGSAGYDLWFNRDERLTRAPELSPRVGTGENGRRFLAPGDGERGGTWLMLNDRGLTVCVLNDYEAVNAVPGRVSRGLLPLACAGCCDAQDALTAARAWAREAGEDSLGPFLLVAVDAAGATRALGWDGRGWTERAEIVFATSSSFAPIRVRQAREAAHVELADKTGRTAAALAGFHWAHAPLAGAESVRMRRPDACTRSICAVRVRAGAAPALAYTAVDWSRADGIGSRTEGVL